MGEKSYPIKLVRDNIESVIGEGSIIYEKVEHEDHVRLLRRKLLEEAIEYLETPSLSELVDVLQVAVTLLKVDLDLDWDDLVLEAQKKRQKRGGFLEGTVMSVTSER